MSRAIAITSMGAISALGVGIQAQFEALQSGRSGILRRSALDTPFHGLHFGEVGMDRSELAHACGATPGISRTALLALVAAQEAMQGIDFLDPARLAVISASTVGGMDRTEKCVERWRKGHFDQAAIALGHPVGDHTAQIAKAVGAKGWVTTLSTACSSSANAIMLGAALLRSGRADMVLAGGTDALCDFTIHGFRSLSAMDDGPCKPFSADRAGMNLGEGAAYLVLELEEHARANGRAPLAILAGGANTNDAHHQTATSPEGEGPYQAMIQALAQAGITAEAVDLVNAHGTGTENNDLTEQIALERAFDEVPPFVSTKSATGHTLAAAGALEAVFSILSIQHGFIPANLRWSAAIPEMRSKPHRTVRMTDVRTVLSTSFGFGGNDSALVLQAS